MAALVGENPQPRERRALEEPVQVPRQLPGDARGRGPVALQQRQVVPGHVKNGQVDNRVAHQEGERGRDAVLEAVRGDRVLQLLFRRQLLHLHGGDLLQRQRRWHRRSSRAITALPMVYILCGENSWKNHARSMRRRKQIGEMSADNRARLNSMQGRHITGWRGGIR